MTTVVNPDGRLERGEQTRRLILRRAADIASVEGLEGLSIGRLSTELEISKSGVFAHFGSKEELQLATVRAAKKIFIDEVITPALQREAGLPRLRALCEGWLGYSEHRTFPGGCFFAAVQPEFSSRPGRVRDAVAEAGTGWSDLIRDQAGKSDLDADPAQVAFEVIAFMEAANVQAILHSDPDAYDRARAAIRARLTPRRS
ncbi:TetR/AcrR family transcriptional regulator [Umezawaea endophytica]|uniref:TetR/AcrR family transcriptional regulator n=1 Tax=Umezawaea endophytica TaxID=1654476 RepID=A0A9X3AJ33_9PSEU|nr:TetR/AcrR family transcriptional regulator [Umezawaea endophytica]MCS7483421.1 TetR/AcrR family transcriptional regulator [Umezawaea endophytica]